MREPGFFDPDSDDGPGRIVLERYVVDGKEVFALCRRLGYQDAHHDEPFVVPADPERFRSDLASVPLLFTWLIPRTGLHLPAALVHDGLMAKKPGRARAGDPADTGEPGVEGRVPQHLGPPVDRTEADRIFRDAMGLLGTSWARRWLIWTAVTLATAFRDLRPRARWVTTVVATLATIVVLGVVATLDLFDVVSLLPWMGDRSWTRELVGGAAAAVVVPVVLSVAWGRIWRAGLVAGIALALLLHVTIVLAGLTAAFRAVERCTRCWDGPGR